MKFSKKYTLTSQVYLDRHSHEYINIVMINMIPEGPLKDFVRRIQLPRLSPFQHENYYRSIPKCGYALTLDRCNLLTVNEIPELFAFLSESGYIIDTSVTNMMNFGDIRLTNRNIICFLKYE